MKKTAVFLAVLVACVGYARAESTARFELQRSFSGAEREVLLNGLYSHYIDCLEMGGSEERCYRRWYRECLTYFDDSCPLLEEIMFSDPAEGDESC